jgi:hypothetical protein
VGGSGFLGGFGAVYFAGGGSCRIQPCAILNMRRGFLISCFQCSPSDTVLKVNQKQRLKSAIPIILHIISSASEVCLHNNDKICAK